MDFVHSIHLGFVFSFFFRILLLLCISLIIHGLLLFIYFLSVSLLLLRSLFVLLSKLLRFFLLSNKFQRTLVKYKTNTRSHTQTHVTNQIKCILLFDTQDCFCFSVCLFICLFNFICFLHGYIVPGYSFFL